MEVEYLCGRYGASDLPTYIERSVILVCPILIIIITVIKINITYFCVEGNGVSIGRLS